MDPRRVPRTVSDPKVRQVGFFAPPDRSQSGPPVTNPGDSSPSDLSPPGNSMSPVMIIPPRNYYTHMAPPPQHISPRRVNAAGPDSSFPVGSYNPSEFFDFVEEEEEQLFRGSFGKFASMPSGGVDAAAKRSVGISGGDTSRVSNLGAPGVAAVGGANVELKNDEKVGKTTLKGKTTKAERRAMQEAQRAAKAASKGEGPTASGNVNAGKPAKAISQKKDNFSVAASEKRSSDRHPDKDRKKEVPHPRLQFDDATKVDKAKKRSVVKQTEVKNRVELFRHLPQYEHGTRLPDLESKFFQVDSVHSAVYKVGLRYLYGDISGGNARCIAMLEAFKESILDYSTPPEKSLIRDLTSKINGYISFLIECRPLSISMGNAIKFLKTRIAQLPLHLSEVEAKATVISDIDRFISEKIILADKVIVEHAVTKIRDGDVLLTYSSSSAVEMIFIHAHELGKKFRVVVVDSRPKLEGQKLLRRLVSKGIHCTYTHINAVSYVMHEVTRVFLGASSILSNGTVYSRVGTACIAMVAHQFHVPVLICCEAYKFHERVQLDSICSNELGDPDAVSKVSGRREIDSLDGWANIEHLQLLNLIYDATPSDYVSMIITDYGMIPPTSVPVIVREYRREQLWIQ